MATLIAVAVLSGRIEPRPTAVDAGDLAAALDGDVDHARIAEVLRSPGPDGTVYPAGTTGLMISEVVSSNGSTLLDEDGDASDWIELHNPTQEPIDVEGFHLSDDDEQPQRWRLPSRVVGPGERLIVFASGKDRAPELGAAAEGLRGAQDAESADPGAADPTGPASTDQGANATDASDDGPDLDDPDGAALSPDERFAQVPGIPALEVRAAGAPGEQLHTDFVLSQGGEPLVLVEPDATLVADRLPPVPIPRDASLGRHPDDRSRTCLFAHASPGEANAEVCHEDLRLGAPSLSVPSGFHAEPFTLDVRTRSSVTGLADLDATATAEPPGDGDAEGTTLAESREPILYTLDGSYPDLEDNPATQVHDPATDGPLTLEIAERNDEPGELTPIPTGFEMRFPPRVEPETELRATVVRARTLHGRESVASYFVGGRFADLELPVVSIVTDPGHLMDDDTGIYVPGTRYRDYVDSDAFDPEHSWRVPANPVERGRLWERPFEDDPRRAVRLEYCPAPNTPDPATDDAAADAAAADEDCALSQDVGLRIHGNFSRALPQKNLRIYARNHYGDDTLDHAFFGEDGPDQHRRLILRVSGNDWGLTMLWDAYLQTLMRGMETDTQAYQPTVVFINGEYWGIKNLRERYDRHYLAITHDVDPDEVVMLARAGIVDEGLPQDGQDYLDLIDAVDAAPMGDPAIVERVEREVDIEGLFDTVIARTFVADTDWPHANVRTWRVRTDPTGTAADRGWPDSLAQPLPTDRPGGPAWGADDGRWRWMNFDLDHAGAGIGRGGEGHATALDKDDTFDALGRFLDADQHQPWAQDLRLLTETLLAVPAYRDAFVARYTHHLEVTFDPERTTSVLDRLSAPLAGEMGRHSARWGYPASTDEWQAHIDELRRFMQARPQVARDQLEQHLGG